MITDSIIPTKKNPVFTAVCTDFGYIETSMWKQWYVEKIRHWGPTFACDYCDAVRYLHDWIKDNSEYVKRLKGIQFKIEMVDGSINEWEEVIYKTVYTISAAKAKQLIIR